MADGPLPVRSRSGASGTRMGIWPDRTPLLRQVHWEALMATLLERALLVLRGTGGEQATSAERTSDTGSSVGIDQTGSEVTRANRQRIGNGSGAGHPPSARRLPGKPGEVSGHATLTGQMHGTETEPAPLLAPDYPAADLPAEMDAMRKEIARRQIQRDIDAERQRLQARFEFERRFRQVIGARFEREQIALTYDYHLSVGPYGYVDLSFGNTATGVGAGPSQMPVRYSVWALTDPNRVRIQGRTLTRVFPFRDCHLEVAPYHLLLAIGEDYKHWQGMI